MIRTVFLLSIVMTVARAGAQDTVRLGVTGKLQYDKVRFRVKPGAKVTIVLHNTDDMAHNLIITKPGARLTVVEAANKMGGQGYIPKMAEVLWFIPVVNPNDTKQVTFVAPAKKGVYPYVCTLPGHGYVMFGAMYVGVDMPDLKSDHNVPSVTHEHHVKKIVEPLHPYTPSPPYLYRVFIDGASPAAIAVSLTNNLSYCWDAGTCYLRFAWSGGFLDNSDLWKGKGDAAAKIIGDIFYRGAKFPFDGKPVYKGYRLVNRYPEFHYTVNGMDVYESIMPGTDSNSIVNHFRIPQQARSFSTTIRKQ
jgi:uncharacterized cupredoxin-like copper-binding protein